MIEHYGDEEASRKADVDWIADASREGWVLLTKDYDGIR